MAKQYDAHRVGSRLAMRLARANDKLATRISAVRRHEESHALRLEQERVPPGADLREATSVNGESPAAAAPTPPKSTGASQPKRKPATRALLIINTKSGPNNDSILRVKEVVERLAAHGIRADVRVKLRKKLARKDAKSAAANGYPLVIAAGGDGTVTAVAEGLLATRTVLGIIPLGTYNNVATSLGVPMNVEAAIALIASGLVRAADVGVVTAAGATRPRIFMEMAAVGLTAAMMPVGSDVKEGRWHKAAAALPSALQMSPTGAELRFDRSAHTRQATTMLIEIANTPRSGPGIITSADARMDDGQLDVAIYHGHTQAMLAARFVAIKTGLLSDDPQIERLSARRVEIHTDNALPVVADSKVVGHTPARFKVRTGCLLVATGRGIGLAQAPHPEVVAAGSVPAAMVEEEHDAVEAAALAKIGAPAAQERRGPLEVAADAFKSVREAIHPSDGEADGRPAARAEAV